MYVEGSGSTQGRQEEAAMFVTHPYLEPAQEDPLGLPKGIINAVPMGIILWILIMYGAVGIAHLF